MNCWLARAASKRKRERMISARAEIVVLRDRYFFFKVCTYATSALIWAAFKVPLNGGILFFPFSIWAWISASVSF